MFGFDNTRQPYPGAATVPDQPVGGVPSVPNDMPPPAQQAVTDEPALMTTNPPLDNGDSTPPNLAMPAEPPVDMASASTPAPSAAPEDLLQLKHQALQQLSPLLGHLDQSPEEKFKTTMMMIQASDNQDLLPAAYDAANAIENEKVRAQALLDIVNEINYFTQQDHHNE